MTAARGQQPRPPRQPWWNWWGVTCVWHRVRCGDRGAGTVLSAVVVLGLCLVLTAGVIALGWMASRRQAGRVADLAALAAAHAVVRGSDGCLRAEQVTLRNQAQLIECRVQGSPPAFAVFVTVGVDLEPRVTGGPRTVQAASVAGSTSP